MPCDISEHQGEHYWPDEGDLRVWPCERTCGFCEVEVRDSSHLRSHVREAHKEDHPGVSVMVGLNRPPVFDVAIHGRTAILAQREAEKQAADAASNQETEDNEVGQSSLSNESAVAGPAIGRGRKVQVTQKAAEMQAQQQQRPKRKPEDTFTAPTRKKARNEPVDTKQSATSYKTTTTKKDAVSDTASTSNKSVVTNNSPEVAVNASFTKDESGDNESTKRGNSKGKTKASHSHSTTDYSVGARDSAKRTSAKSKTNNLSRATASFSSTSNLTALNGSTSHTTTNGEINGRTNSTGPSEVDDGVTIIQSPNNVGQPRTESSLVVEPAPGVEPSRAQTPVHQATRRTTRASAATQLNEVEGTSSNKDRSLASRRFASPTITPRTVNQDEVFNRIKSNMRGLFIYGEASGLARQRVYDACQDALREWMFAPNDPDAQ